MSNSLEHKIPTGMSEYPEIELLSLNEKENFLHL